jgi:hypothetical protein
LGLTVRKLCPHSTGLLNFFSFLTVLFFLPETNKGAKSDKKKGVRNPYSDTSELLLFLTYGVVCTTTAIKSLREGLKVVLKDWLMSKLILASCLGSFCNGGLLVAMVLFYSLAIEVCRIAPLLPQSSD